MCCWLMGVGFEHSLSCYLFDTWHRVFTTVARSLKAQRSFFWGVHVLLSNLKLDTASVCLAALWTSLGGNVWHNDSLLWWNSVLPACCCTHKHAHTHKGPWRCQWWTCSWGIAFSWAQSCLVCTGLYGMALHVTYPLLIFIVLRLNLPFWKLWIWRLNKCVWKKLTWILCLIISALSCPLPRSTRTGESKKRLKSASELQQLGTKIIDS